MISFWNLKALDRPMPSELDALPPVPRFVQTLADFFFVGGGELKLLVTDQRGRDCKNCCERKRESLLAETQKTGQELTSEEIHERTQRTFCDCEPPQRRIDFEAETTDGSIIETLRHISLDEVDFLVPCLRVSAEALRRTDPEFGDRPVDAVFEFGRNVAEITEELRRELEGSEQ